MTFTMSPAWAASEAFGLERVVLPQAARPIVHHGDEALLLALVVLSEHAELPLLT
jgi:hypothetical protein